MKNLSQILMFANMATMVFLIIVIAMQRKGSGLGTVFGGSGSIAQTRRGVDKWLYYVTIILAVLFVSLSTTVLLLDK